MPKCRDARVVVLCEDNRHYHFVRGFLKAKGVRTDDDRLLMLIPARNIETWLYLIEHEDPVDETTDFKARCRHAKPGKLGLSLAAICPTLALPSALQQARDDWRRLCG